MATIRTEKIVLSPTFQMEISPGWYLDTDKSRYTLIHGKKCMTFDSGVIKDLCARNYSIRLAKGRRHMILPPHVLQAFVENETFLTWYTGSDFQIPQNT